MTTTEATVEPMIDPALIALDWTCDRCVAHAVVKVELSTGGELRFCGHHFDEQHVHLENVGAVIHDERDLKPASA